MTAVDEVLAFTLYLNTLSQETYRWYKGRLPGMKPERGKWRYMDVCFESVSMRSKRQTEERSPKLLGFPAHLMTRLAFSGRMTRLFAVMVTAIKQCTTDGAARHLFLRTTDVFHCRVLTTCARLGREVRTRRACVGFVTGVRRLWMTAAGRWSMARVSALDDSATRVGGQPLSTHQERSTHHLIGGCMTVLPQAQANSS